MEPTNELIYSGLESLKEGKLVIIVPQGISMLPFIKGGEDRVYLLKREKVEVGDIVLVYYRGRHILHRVYAMEGDRIRLMGDGNLEGCECVMAEEILGTAVEIEHNGRRHKPSKAWLWRHLIPFRRVLLKVHRKWNRIMGTSRK